MKRSRLPWRALLALTAAVLAIHLLLLRAAPAAPHPISMLGQQALITRTIAVAPALPDVAVASAAPAPAQPMALARPSAARPVAVSPRADAQGPLRTTQRPAAAASSMPQTGSAPATRATAPVAFVIPRSVLLRYQVVAQTRNLSWQGSGQLHWRHDGSDYEARLEVSAPLLPSRIQRSTGRITAEGLAPLRFSDKGRSEEAAHFQRDQGKVSFSSNRPDAALMAGAQDRLSVLLQLGAMIAGNPKGFGPATTITIQTASTRDAEPWQFKVEGEEQLQLPGGALNALKLTRAPRKEFDQTIELWLAPAMDYVPVRLRLTQPNGDWVDQQWSSTDRG